jgi:hypothetical protein
LDDLIVGATYADPSGKSNAGKSYVVFGKADGSAINLSAIAAANNPTGGLIIAQFYQVYGIGVSFTEDDIRFTT